MKYKFSFFVVSLAFTTVKAFSKDIEYNYKTSYKTKYIAKLGTTVDDKSVIQPYIEAKFNSNFYTSLWLNIPLTKKNPKRSLEIEPSIGYKKSNNNWGFDTSVTYIDLQNPKVLDFSGDVLNSKIKLTKDNHYIEVLHYMASNANNGWLLGIGTKFNIENVLSLSANLRYSDGPFSLEPMYYGQFNLSHEIKELNLVFTVELLKIFKKTNHLEQRDDEIALSASYKF